MPQSRLTGSRIRERRLLTGMRQSQLAQAVGISPSYLNLIEHNRRRIGGKLLNDIAQLLEVEVSLLAEGAEAALIERLRRASAEDGDDPAELAQAEEFAGRFPGWAQLVSAQHRRIRGLERTVQTLNDRLAHDPHLAATLHEVLDTATAIRSTAAILAETREIEPEWRDRFNRNINEDAERLADGARSLAGYLDATAESDDDLSSPQEEVEAFWRVNGGHFPALENAGPDEAGAAQHDGALVAALIRAAPELVSASARAQATTLLTRYLGDARAMPLAQVVEVLDEAGSDPLVLAARFRSDPAAAMRRIASVPGSEAGLVICDGSGTLTFRRPVEGFVLPRFGAACPRWPLFRALSRPLTPLQERLHQPGRGGAREPGRGFNVFAVAQPVGQPEANRDPLFEAHMLILPAASDGAEADASVVGATCRICAARACPARREMSIMADGF